MTYQDIPQRCMHNNFNFFSNNMGINSRDSSYQKIQKQATHGNGQPKQKRDHKRALSLQARFMFGSKSGDSFGNSTTESVNKEGSVKNTHKRVNSKDHLGTRKGHMFNPLVNRSMRTYDNKFNRFRTDLETVEDKDEKNSSSVATSIHQNKLKSIANRSKAH